MDDEGESEVTMRMALRTRTRIRKRRRRKALLRHSLTWKVILDIDFGHG